MKKAELVFIPLPAMGHIIAAVEIAKLIVERDDRISTSVLIMRPTLDSTTTKYTESLSPSTLPNRMRVVDLPCLEHTAVHKTGASWMASLAEAQKNHVKEFVSKIKAQSELSPNDSPRLAGFVLDTFVLGMNDLAAEFGVPWYVFSASGAAFIGSMLYLQALHDEQKADLPEYKDSDAELEIPSLVNRLPAKLLPSLVFDRESLPIFLGAARRLKHARGILINTFKELESHAINSLSKGEIPPVYPLGPIVRCKGNSYDVGSSQINDYKDIMQWLDDQPPCSVVFLCFRSWGSFSVDQVKENAYALEQCGHRFLWCLRERPCKGKIESPSDYVNFQDILPEGFLDRSVKIGKVIKWAPQVEILGHKAIGGFVSHCGWNSTLESILSGVPIATWPLYGEQQFNAFEIVIELGLGVEIKIDSGIDIIEGAIGEIVSSDDIKRGLKLLMENGSEIRKKVKEMSQLSRKALMEDGSSYSALTRLIEDVMDSIACHDCSLLS
uniref:Glycosyltransferase n=1 Tax=Populus trichocarpa TaxID=3694 RepID=A0A2K1X978_POPTR|eukprot:XP_006373637.2 anthocyanidin 3-O-glucosyltransferase 6 [Populus trichocarpa]